MGGKVQVHVGSARERLQIIYKNDRVVVILFRVKLSDLVPRTKV